MEKPCSCDPFSFQGSIDEESPCSPEIQNVSVGPIHYDSSVPTISNQQPLTYSQLTGLTETLGANRCSSDGNPDTDGVKYTLSADGASWWWFNSATSSWEIASSAGDNYLLANTAQSLSPDVLQKFSTQVGPGNLYFKAFLKLDGEHSCELNDLSLSGTK